MRLVNISLTTKKNLKHRVSNSKSFRSTYENNNDLLLKKWQIAEEPE